MEEALKILESADGESRIQTVLLKCQILLGVKRQKEGVLTLATYVEKHASVQESQLLIGLILRLAHNYKALDSEELQAFIKNQVTKQLNQSKQGKVDTKLIEALVSVGQTEEAFRLIDKLDFAQIKKDK